MLTKPDVLDRLRFVWDDGTFADKKASKSIMKPMPDLDKYLEKKRVVENMVAKGIPNGDNRTFYEEPILSSKQINHLFRQYNYLKFLAKKRADKHDWKRTFSIMERADKIRSILILANTRLYRLINKWGRIRDDITDAYIGLISAIDRFDYRRGIKFNTYATKVMQSRMIPYIPKHNINLVHIVPAIEEQLHSKVNEQETIEQNEINSLIREAVSYLPEREKFIITETYFKGRQFKDVAKELGISKERTRQNHLRALKMIYEYNPKALEGYQGIARDEERNKHTI